MASGHSYLLCVTLLLVIYVFPTSEPQGIKKCMTVEVEVVYSRESLLEKYSKVEESSASSEFRNEMKKLEQGGGISAGYGGFSAEVNFQFSQMYSDTKGSSGSSCRAETKTLKYQPDMVQVWRQITYVFTINQQQARRIEKKWINVQMKKKECPDDDGRNLKMARDYLESTYGNTNGTISGSTYKETTCKVLRKCNII